jgi:hypothetical protein
MYPLIPYKYFVIDTNLSFEDARSLVGDNIAPPRSFFQTRTPGKEFEGNVASDGFTINRAILYRTFFLPFLNGRFIQYKSGTRIKMYITLHPIKLVLSSILFYPLFEMIVLVIRDFLINSHINVNNLSSTGTFLGYFYLIGLLLFGFEAKKAEKFIRMIYKKYEHPTNATILAQQNQLQRMAFTIGGLALIAGLIISWFFFNY